MNAGAWTELKVRFAEATVAMDALHIYSGFLVQILAALLLRRSLASPLPWLAVLAAEIANEWLDLFRGETAQVEPWQLDGAVHDLVNTMVLPTALMLLTRYAPRLFARPLPPDRRQD